MISGACLMIKREVFQQIGRFSEEYFMYTEDADLLLQGKPGGMETYHVPEATVVHFGGGSSKQAVSNFSAIMMRESIWKFLRKTHGNLYGAGYRWSMLLVACCRLGLLGLLSPLQGLRRQPRSGTRSANGGQLERVPAGADETISDTPRRRPLNNAKLQRH